MRPSSLLVTFARRIYALIVHTGDFRWTHICAHSTQRVNGESKFKGFLMGILYAALIDDFMLYDVMTIFSYVGK